MNWLLRLYPTRWRERYGDEFGAVLASQRVSAGLVLDVLAGAVDAHLHPQVQHSQSQQIKEGEDTMTVAMLQRCAAGGPKLLPADRRVAERFTVLSALVIALIYLVLTKIYREAPAAQAVLYASFPALSFVYGQTAYLRKRRWLTQALVLAGGLSALYLFMLAVCVIAGKL